MKDVKVLQKDGRHWEPHPQLATAQVAYLLSHRDEEAELTCLLVHLRPGTQVEKHTHECDDIIYVLQGKAKLWIEGTGDIPLVEGTFVRVPRGVMHQPHSVEEDFVAYDIYYPFLA